MFAEELLCLQLVGPGTEGCWGCCGVQSTSVGHCGCWDGGRAICDALKKEEPGGGLTFHWITFAE